MEDGCGSKNEGRLEARGGCDDIVVKADLRGRQLTLDFTGSAAQHATAT